MTSETHQVALILKHGCFLPATAQLLSMGYKSTLQSGLCSGVPSESSIKKTGKIEQHAALFFQLKQWTRDGNLTDPIIVNGVCQAPPLNRTIFLFLEQNRKMETPASSVDLALVWYSSSSPFK